MSPTNSFSQLPPEIVDNICEHLLPNDRSRCSRVAKFLSSSISRIGLFPRKVKQLEISAEEILLQPFRGPHMRVSLEKCEVHWFLMAYRRISPSSEVWHATTDFNKLCTIILQYLKQLIWCERVIISLEKDTRLFMRTTSLFRCRELIVHVYRNNVNFTQIKNFYLPLKNLLECCQSNEISIHINPFHKRVPIGSDVISHPTILAARDMRIYGASYTEDAGSTLMKLNCSVIHLEVVSFRIVRDFIQQWFEGSKNFTKAAFRFPLSDMDTLENELKLFCSLQMCESSADERLYTVRRIDRKNATLSIRPFSLQFSSRK